VNLFSLSMLKTSCSNNDSFVPEMTYMHMVIWARYMYVQFLLPSGWASVLDRNWPHVCNTFGSQADYQRQLTKAKLSFFECAYPAVWLTRQDAAWGLYPRTSPPGWRKIECTDSVWLSEVGTSWGMAGPETVYLHTMTVLNDTSERANKRGVTKFCGHFRLLILGHSWLNSHPIRLF
jgi:hypothetical protein